MSIFVLGQRRAEPGHSIDYLYANLRMGRPREGRPYRAPDIYPLNLSCRAGILPSRLAAGGSRAYLAGQGFARQLVVTHGCVIDKGRYDRCSLLHILFLDAVIDVHVGVMCAASVLNGILNELEAWNPDCVEREMIGASRILQAQGCGSHLSERFQPLAEERRNGLIALQIDSANLAGPV